MVNCRRLGLSVSSRARPVANGRLGKMQARMRWLEALAKDRAGGNRGHERSPNPCQNRRSAGCQAGQHANHPAAAKGKLERRIGDPVADEIPARIDPVVVGEQTVVVFADVQPVRATPLARRAEQKAYAGKLAARGQL